MEFLRPLGRCLYRSDCGLRPCCQRGRGGPWLQAPAYGLNLAQQWGPDLVRAVSLNHMPALNRFFYDMGLPDYIVANPFFGTLSQAYEKTGSVRGTLCTTGLLFQILCPSEFSTPNIPPKYTSQSWTRPCPP